MNSFFGPKTTPTINIQLIFFSSLATSLIYRICTFMQAHDSNIFKTDLQSLISSISNEFFMRFCSLFWIELFITIQFSFCLFVPNIWLKAHAGSCNVSLCPNDAKLAQSSWGLYTNGDQHKGSHERCENSLLFFK